jgi:hypothetical protein
MSDIISSAWCKACIQPEYTCECADAQLEDSVADKMAAGMPMAQAIAELVELRKRPAQRALRRRDLCQSCGDELGDEEAKELGRCSACLEAVGLRIVRE